MRKLAEVKYMFEAGNNKYADIINLEHHQSSTHPHMSRYDRAAQFSPFAALTGHEEAIREKARLNEFKTDIERVENIDDLWENYSEKYDEFD